MGGLKYFSGQEMNDCPWSENTCLSAHQNGHDEVSEWAEENGCP